jgi:hypothetical protein
VKFNETNGYAVKHQHQRSDFMANIAFDRLHESRRLRNSEKY